MTLRVASMSASVAGAISMVCTWSLPRPMLLLTNGAPRGLSTDACVTPVFGSVRFGLARLYTTLSSLAPRCLRSAIVRALISSV